MCFCKKEFKINPQNISKISKLGFTYNKLLSDKDTKIYTYRFPVEKYNNYYSIFCEININIDTFIVSINVLYRDGSIYTPLYKNEFGNYKNKENIINKIQEKLNYFGIINI